MRYTAIYQDRRCPPERVDTLTVVVLDRVERVYDHLMGLWLAPERRNGEWILVVQP